MHRIIAQDSCCITIGCRHSTTADTKKFVISSDAECHVARCGGSLDRKDTCINPKLLGIERKTRSHSWKRGSCPDLYKVSESPRDNEDPSSPALSLLCTLREQGDAAGVWRSTCPWVLAHMLRVEACQRRGTRIEVRHFIHSYLCLAVIEVPKSISSSPSFAPASAYIRCTQ